MSSDKANTLLIVEDDLALQKQIKWSLDQFESVTADDRQSAMVQLRRFVPAVVTMDLGLPPDADSVSEGFKLLEQILAAEPDTKVIVLTGQNGQANALKAIAMGAYDFLAKPFEPEVLALTVERAFRLAELQAVETAIGPTLKRMGTVLRLEARGADVLGWLENKTLGEFPEVVSEKLKTRVLHTIDMPRSFAVFVTETGADVGLFETPRTTFSEGFDCIDSILGETTREGILRAMGVDEARIEQAGTPASPT